MPHLVAITADFFRVLDCLSASPNSSSDTPSQYISAKSKGCIRFHEQPILLSGQIRELWRLPFEPPRCLQYASSQRLNVIPSKYFYQFGLLSLEQAGDAR